MIAGSGEYEVPVREELKPHARFKMKNISVVQNDKFVSLSYSLPTEISGIPLPSNTFTGKVNPGKDLYLTGTFGNIVCDTSKIELKSQCLVGYNQDYKDYLEILDPQIEEAMESNISDPNLLMIRKEIWEGFSGDPLGFIYFDDINSLDL